MSRSRSPDSGHIVMRCCCATRHRAPLVAPLYSSNGRHLFHIEFTQVRSLYIDIFNRNIVVTCDMIDSFRYIIKLDIEHVFVDQV